MLRGPWFESYTGLMCISLGTRNESEGSTWPRCKLVPWETCLCKLDIPGHGMLAAHKTGTEIVSVTFLPTSPMPSGNNCIGHESRDYFVLVRCDLSKEIVLVRCDLNWQIVLLLHSFCDMIYIFWTSNFIYVHSQNCNNKKSACSECTRAGTTAVC